MKKLILSFLCLPLLALGQTFPVNNLQINGVVSGNVTGAGNVILQTSPSITTPAISSPVLSGIPTVPTAAVGTNTTQIASTAYTNNHSPCQSIMDNGGDNTGVSDNSAALTNTINAAQNPTGKVCVYLPPGTYAFSSQYVYTLPNASASIAITGAGSDVSILKWAAGGGLRINIAGVFNSFTVRDLSLVTGSTNTGTGLDIENNNVTLSPQAISKIINVAVHGADGYGVTNSWAIGINVNNVNNVNMINPSVWGGAVGTAIGMQFTSGTQLAVQYDVFGADIQNIGTGIQYTGYSQGLSITGSNIVGCTNGILIPASQHTTNLVVTNSQISCTFAGIQDLTGNLFTQLSNNLFIIPPNASTNAAAVFLPKSCGFTASGNVFYNGGSVTPTFGVLIQNQGCSGLVSTIVGNVFQNVANGVYLDSGSRNVNVQSNAYGGVTTPTTNLGGGTNTIGGGSS